MTAPSPASSGLDAKDDKPGLLFRFVDGKMVGRPEGAGWNACTWMRDPLEPASIRAIYCRS